MTQQSTDLVLAKEREQAIVEFRDQDAGRAHGLALVRLKVGGAGATQFEAETGQYLSALTGIVMVSRMARMFWIDSFEATGGGNPPDCKSDDMEQGSVSSGVYENLDRTLIAEFGGDCATCPQNRWGSAERGKGKRCRETRNLAIKSQEIGPCLLRLPPTSLRAVDLFESGAEGIGQYYNMVLTKLTLVKVTPKGSVAYAQARFEILRHLDALEVAQVRLERPLWLEYLERMATFGEDENAQAEDKGNGGVEI